MPTTNLALTDLLEWQTFASSEEITSTAVAPNPSSWLNGLGTALVAWLKYCADSYAAASAYEDLTRLCDVELKHRGLSRGILARDLSAQD